MHILDIVLILAYVGALVWITVRSSGADFYTGGKKAKTPLLVFSLLATETSGATVLIFPDLGFNPNHRFLLLQMVTGYLIGRIIIGYLIVPPIYNSGEVSIYRYFRSVSPAFSNLSVGFFTLAAILAAGVRLFIASLGLYTLISGAGGITGTPDLVYTIIVIIAGGGLATAYSSLGGMNAVLRTDRLQFFIILFGTFGLLAFGLLDYQTMQLPALTIDSFIRLPENIFADGHTFPIALITGVIITLGSHGADQTLFQRVLAAGDERTARMSMIYSGILIIPFISLFLFVGYVLAGSSFAQANEVENIFPAFAGYLGVPFVGLFTVIFLAAAMSSIDSCLHSLSTALKSAGVGEGLKPERLAVFSGSFLIIAAIGFATLKLAFPKSPLLAFALSATGLIFAPMAATFISILLGRKKEVTPNASLSFVSGFLVACSLFLANLSDDVQIWWGWTVVAAFTTSFLLGFITRRPDQKQL